MCGLVGAAGNLNSQHEKLVRTLLILDSVRGEDSTGIATIGKWDPKPKLAKQVGDPFQLFDHKSFDNVFTGLQRAIIGHNRYATTGVVNRVNAHPFENNSIVGAHNGTLNTKHLLADPKDFVVDSENIFHHFDKYGVRDALKYMGGAWALTWWDKDEHTMNFLRNKERPLYMARSKNDECIFWASEYWMLYGALGKHGIDYQEIELLPEDLHISIAINKEGKMEKPIARREPSTYVAPPVTTYNNQPRQGHVVPKEEPAVAPVKKPDGAVAAVVNGCESFYLSAKNRRVETHSIVTEKDGTSYIACFDPLRQYHDVRLYPKPDSPLWDAVGSEIYADVQGYRTGDTPGKGHYYLHTTGVVVIAPPVVKKEDPVVEPVVVEEETQLMGPTGKWMTKVMFDKQYPDCGYCSNPLVFGDRNRFTTAGECLCPGCATDQKVLEVVSLH